MKQYGLCLIIWAAFVSAGCSRSPQAIEATAAQPASATVAPALPPYRGPLVELRGTAEQIGTEHGIELGPQIQLLHEQYLNVYLRNTARRMVALAAARMFESYFPPDDLTEVEAMARQTQMDEREAVLAQCFLDLSPMVACSTIALPAAAAPDHVARFGRNLDFPSLNVADKYSTVFIYHPAGRYSFAAIGWPGMVGVLSGMNEHGLSLANMEIRRLPRLPAAMPYTLLYRQVLERCRTVAEAIDLIERTPRQTSNNLMLMDATGDRAVAEITPQSVTVRRAPDTEPLISTNHQRGTDCDTTGRCRRYDYLHAEGERAFGSIDLEKLHSMLAHVAQGKETLQSMVFEPSNRVIYLATGANAASGTFYRIDLKPHFSPTTASR